MSVVVIGGGPAGAMAAALLAAAGRDVTVLERESAPANKVCGEFLSVEAAASAASLGLDLRAAGAQSIGTVRLIHGARTAAAALPFPAFGLSRRRFDAMLLDRAEAFGAQVLRGCKAIGVGPDGRVSYRGGRKESSLAADAVILATGKHELRGAQRAAADPGWVGLKTYLRLAPAEIEDLPGAVEIVLFRGGYAGLLLVEHGAATLCLIVRALRLAELGGWDGLRAALTRASPHFARRLWGAEALLSRPLAVSRVPYGFLHRPSASDSPRIWRIGDQAAVIPSLTGDGVAIALASGAGAARAFLAGETAAAHHARLARSFWGQMRRAQLMHALCARASTQLPLLALCRVAPSLMRLAASWTRLASG